MPAARIVLVEDDDSIRLVAQMSLETLGGHEVRAFASGQEALEAAAGFQPDLLLLDAHSHVHLAYRPGVPLTAAVWKGGVRTER